MSFLGRINNTLKPIGQSIVNGTSNAIDRGVGGLGVTVNTSTKSQVKNLDDLNIVDKTIANARRAIEIDPTTWACTISMTILANKEYKIVGDDGADPDAIQHIIDKSKDWNLTSNMISTTWKGIIDGRCFIEKYIEPELPTIQEINHLMYDENIYNFMELRDPISSEILGYKQRAKIYPVNDDWKNQNFLTLLNRPWVWQDTNFDANQIIMPKLFESDGNSEGMVFKVLDDVYALKELKNMVPLAAKIGASTLGVQVGNKDSPFKPYNESDDFSTKKSKLQAEMNGIANTFTERFKKDLVLYDAGISTQMIGTLGSNITEMIAGIDMFRQEIMTALLTPDSRFASKSSNRAVAQEQMSGDMGQIKVLSYLQEQFLCPNYEQNLFDHELQLAGFDDSLGLIHIDYEEQNKEDEVDLATIAAGVMAVKPDIDPELVIDTYFPRIAPAMKLLDTVNDPTDPTNINNSLGVIDRSNPSILINTYKKRLEREGILI